MAIEMNRQAAQAGPMRWVALVVFVAICLLAGGLGTVATEPNIPTWYAALNKPAFNPPNGVFPIVWTVLYVLMAVAAWLAWRAGPSRLRNMAMVAFAVQLALNVAWSFAFFGAHSPALGLAVIALLLLAILWTAALFARLSRPAGWLLAPYFLWVCFATALNLAIFLLN